jgi:hypothetical protein
MKKLLNRISNLASSNFKIKKTNYLLTQNLIIMKKQISLMTVALFACIAVTFGQAAPNPLGPGPRPLTCETGPLNPIAGVPYEYEASASPDGGSAYWYATFSTSFITGGERVATEEVIGAPGSAIANGSENYMQLIDPANSPFGTTIIWTTDGLATVDDDNPLFVVVEYETPEGGCSNNMKAYKISPVNAFLVNIVNHGLGYDIPDQSCFSEISSATWNGNEMQYDFGTNVLAFEVIAANFTVSYDLNFRIEGLEPDQQAQIYYSGTDDFQNATSYGGLVGNGIVAGPTITTNEEDTSAGVSIFVWLEIHNYNFEGLADIPITLAVAGENTAGQPNVRWEDCLIAVNINELYENNGPDYATHTLQSRPTITPESGEFVPQIEP